jgi:threonine/homoserine/homoserine lactone efflux protein
MTSALVAGVIAGYGVAVPVGAVGVLIAGLSARVSLRVGAAAGMGAATADGLYATAAVLGGAALAETIAPWSAPLRWIAAAVLVALAVHTVRSALAARGTTAADSRGTRPLTAYLTSPRARLLTSVVSAAIIAALAVAVLMPQ